LAPRQVCAEYQPATTFTLDPNMPSKNVVDQHYQTLSVIVSLGWYIQLVMITSSTDAKCPPLAHNDLIVFILFQ
jgi:hypothetical protein